MKKHLSILATLFALAFVLVPAVSAQATALTISFSRDFGYSSGSGDIQGLFTITARGPQNLAKVVFYIDDRQFGEADQSPFKLQFNTDQFATGVHQIYGIGTTTSGNQIKSQTISARFVTAQEGLQAGLRIAVPILVIVFGAMLVATLVPILTGRRVKDLPAGTPRSYTLGGAVCPKCGRPFAFHLFGMNLLGHKFDRCPYCGRWSLVGYASLERLRSAEQAELANVVSDGAGQVPGLSDEEKLKKELDDSKYRDL